MGFRITCLFALSLIFILRIDTFSQSKDTSGKTIPIKARPTTMFSGIALEAGIQTTSILGDNPGKWSILERDTNIKREIGGSFKGSQMGYSLRAVFSLDQANRFSVPVGLDYIMYEARERVPLAVGTVLFMKHTINVPTVVLGINYKAFKFPIANVWGYAGLEARGAYLLGNEFYSEIEYRTSNTFDIRDTTAKGAAFRIGGALRLGFEGEIQEPVFINVSCAFGALNLIGRDHDRGELLTPLGKPLTSEKEETVVFNFHFALLLQYRF